MSQYRMTDFSPELASQRILVFFLFFLLPTQLTKHFWPIWSYVQGIRIDYLSPTIALIDIIALLILVVHIHVLVQFIRTSNRATLIILGLLIGTNIVFSTLPLHSTLTWLRILLYCTTMSIVVQKMHRHLSAILVGLALGSVIQFLLVCMQYIGQSSLQGVWYWLGERSIVMSLPDVAKISVYGREYLRPYGTFSHPNALGGFYVLLFFWIFWFKTHLAVKDKRYALLTNIILFICPFLVLASFSKVAIFSFVLGSLILVWGDYEYRKCLICLLARSSVLIVVLLLFTVPVGDPYSAQKRLVLMGNSLQIIVENPLWGVGLGNYVLAHSSISILPRYIPLYQPVHNIFLLLLAEVGIGGTMLMYLIVRQLKLVFSYSPNLLPIIMVVVLTGISDHYWVTQTQTQMLLTFVTLCILLPFPVLQMESKKRPL